MFIRRNRERERARKREQERKTLYLLPKPNLLFFGKRKGSAVKLFCAYSFLVGKYLLFSLSDSICIICENLCETDFKKL